MEAIAIGFGGVAAAAPPPDDAGEAAAPGDDAVAAPPDPDAGAQALPLPSVSPATTHGVVSDLSSITLPGGWLTEMVAVPDVLLPDVLPPAALLPEVPLPDAAAGVELPEPVDPPARAVNAVAASVDDR